MRRLARLLVPSATAGCVLGLGAVHASWIGRYGFATTSRFGWSLAYVGLCWLAAYSVGLPDLPRNAYAALAAGLEASVAAALGISGVQAALGSAVLPRFVVFWSAAFLPPAWGLCAFVSAQGGRRPPQERVLAVAGPAEAAALEEDLAGPAGAGILLAAVLSPAEALPTASGPAPLKQAAQAAGASLIVLDRAALAHEAVVAQAAELHAAGRRVRTLSLFYDQWLGKLPVFELEQASLMFDIGELHRARYSRIKRLVDVVAGALGCLALAALVPAVWALQRLANPGPLLFRQQRVGKGGRPVFVYKFRTMPPGADQAAWCGPNDPRLNRLGRLMRRVHLDEVPQFLNVLRGDLSLVGPRPEQPTHVARLSRKIPFFELRHLVRPGMTGWAQVNRPYGASEEEATEKLQYDFYYLAHQSLALDLRILGRTLRSVVRLEGR
jgi:lipopolysaccharide/colanic/teichoic acid biosynthesis glycosyltransferase